MARTTLPDANESQVASVPQQHSGRLQERGMILYGIETPDDADHGLRLGNAPCSPRPSTGLRVRPEALQIESVRHDNHLRCRIAPVTVVFGPGPRIDDDEVR